jgi:hypothetical protein
MSRYDMIYREYVSSSILEEGVCESHVHQYFVYRVDSCKRQSSTHDPSLHDFTLHDLHLHVCVMQGNEGLFVHMHPGVRCIHVRICSNRREHCLFFFYTFSPSPIPPIQTRDTCISTFVRGYDGDKTTMRKAGCQLPGGSFEDVVR